MRVRKSPIAGCLSSYASTIKPIRCIFVSDDKEFHVNKFDSTTETKLFYLLSLPSYVKFFQIQSRHVLLTLLTSLITLSA